MLWPDCRNVSLRPELFLLVDLREHFFSDLASGDQKKKL